MDKQYYFISDAAEMIHVETHVLRYWEEELGLSVSRNEHGHRYYTKENIKTFQKIKALKDQGYQLRAIKKILEDDTKVEDFDLMTVMSAEEKYEQFREMLTSIVGHAISMNNEELSEAIADRVQEQVIKEMNYLSREQEEALERHFKDLDTSLRKHAGLKTKKPSLKIRKFFTKPVTP